MHDTYGFNTYVMFIDQRARISLARAMYEQADVYLLDDPLSPLPTYTRKKIFKDCIVDHLKDTTRVLVTRDITELYHCHNILLFNKNGEYEGEGTYEKIKDHLLIGVTAPPPISEHTFIDNKLFPKDCKIEKCNDATTITDPKVLCNFISDKILTADDTDTKAKTLVVDIIKTIGIDQYIRQYIYKTKNTATIENDSHKYTDFAENFELSSSSPPGS